MQNTINMADHISLYEFEHMIREFANKLKNGERIAPLRYRWFKHLGESLINDEEIPAHVKSIARESIKEFEECAA